MLESGKSVVHEIDLFRFLTQANADSLGRFAGFRDRVLSKRYLFGAPLNVDGDTICGAAVFDNVLFNQISVSTETGSAFGPEQDAGLPTISHDVLPHDVVCIAVADRDPLPFNIEDRVLFSQTVFHSPAEEQSDLTPFKLVTTHDGSL